VPLGSEAITARVGEGRVGGREGNPGETDSVPIIATKKNEGGKKKVKAERTAAGDSGEEDPRAQTAEVKNQNAQFSITQSTGCRGRASW